MATLTTGIMFLIFTCMLFWVWEILRRWSACAPTAYEVVHDCRKFEEHCRKIYMTKLYLYMLPINFKRVQQHSNTIHCDVFV
jgi:hypothetical protein